MTRTLKLIFWTVFILQVFVTITKNLRDVKSYIALNRKLKIIIINLYFHNISLIMIIVDAVLHFS